MARIVPSRRLACVHLGGRTPKDPADGNVSQNRQTAALPLLFQGERVHQSYPDDHRTLKTSANDDGARVWSNLAVFVKA